MADTSHVVGPIPNIGARRVAWDRTGALAITLADDDRLIGLSADEDVWEQPCNGTHELTWDPRARLLIVIGDTLLVDASGVARATRDGSVLALSPSDELLSIHRAGQIVDIIDWRGSLQYTTNSPCVEWHPFSDTAAVVTDDGIQLVTAHGTEAVIADDGERSNLKVCWSPGGEHLAVWGSYGQFDVHGRDGALISSFPAHLGDPNVAADLGTTVLVTAGGDGHMIVYDLIRSAVHTSIEIGQPPSSVRLDPTERFIVATAGGEVVVCDANSSRRVGPSRPAIAVDWHPSTATLACCDGAAIWLEVFDRH